MSGAYGLEAEFAAEVNDAVWIGIWVGTSGSEVGSRMLGGSVGRMREVSAAELTNSGELSTAELDTGVWTLIGRSFVWEEECCGRL